MDTIAIPSRANSLADNLDIPSLASLVLTIQEIAMHLYGSLLPLAATLIFSNTTAAASVLRRDPSTLINLRHPEPQPASNQFPASLGTLTAVSPPLNDTTKHKLLNTRDQSSPPSPDQFNQKQPPKGNKLTISGHGVVAVPITPEGDHIHVEIESGSQIIDNNNADSTNSEYIHPVKVGPTSFQVLGPDLTITDNRDDDSSSSGGPGAIPDDEMDNHGQMAAMAFAQAAEEIMAKNKMDQVSGPRGTRRYDVSSAEIMIPVVRVSTQTGQGGHVKEQEHEQIQRASRRRRRSLSS
ncbi:hypothetical protein QBC37DRAFT_396681 [Rhypophila decipiens]|uniref:Uncharacterized protein n=1 Tax=Rhypophila decipiens TaxID=261697 RepID=A0AAN7BDZ6_9PEZI|nr:hypothetical protein QBC37DRAFT_396681 [Rhypophila decipiens]